MDSRYTRNQEIIDQGKLNKFLVLIAGCGAIGSHLARILAHMGVSKFTLIDPQTVEIENLSVQGFTESDMGKPKVEAVNKVIHEINSEAVVETFQEPYHPRMISGDSIIFSAVDSMAARKRIFSDYSKNRSPLFIDGRMSAEYLQVFTVPKTPEYLQNYKQSLFDDSQAYQDSCTAKSTVYCASMASAIMAAQLKKFSMDQEIRPVIEFNIASMDMF